MFTYYLKSDICIYIYICTIEIQVQHVLGRSINYYKLNVYMLPLDFDRPRSKHSWLGEKRFGFPILHHKLLPKLFELQRPNLVGTNLPLALLVPALLLNQKQAPLPSMVKDRCRLRMLLIRVYPRKVSIFSSLWLSSDTSDCTYWLQHLSSRFGNNILASGATAGFFVRAMAVPKSCSGDHWLLAHSKSL